MAVPAPMTWHQLQKKVLVNCEIPNLTDVAITIGEKSFSFAAKAGGKEFQMDVPLAHDVVVEESRWFGNDRAVSIVLTKTDNSCFWEKLSTDASLKRIVKPDLINWQVRRRGARAPGGRAPSARERDA